MCRIKRYRDRQGRRTSRCSRPGPHHGFSRYAVQPAAPAAELVRSGATRGCRGNCVALREEMTPPAVLPAVCYRGVRPWQGGGAKASAQRTLIPKGMATEARAEVATASIKAVGDQQRVVRSTQVNCRKRRHKEQAKGADRLGPKR